MASTGIRGVTLIAAIVGWWCGSSASSITWKAPICGFIAMVVAGKLLHRGLEVVAKGLVAPGQAEPSSEATT